MTEDLARLGALEAGAGIAAHRFTSEDVVRACLARIAETDGEIGAWIYLDPDAALAEAKARDAERPRGPLHGVPVGVKDIVDTHDMPTGCGSPIYHGHRPPADAACVALLRAAGMVVLGKTVTTEFAMRHPGRTHNPHRHGHTPGGSSSGSAAAVAANMVPLAIGTQTAGSVIRPASYCGVVGFKPTFGRIPRAGVKLLAESLDTIGCMARSVGDAAAFATAMEGFPAAGAPHLDHAPRLGFCRSPAWPDAEIGLDDVMNEGIGRLRRGGANVLEVELPKVFDDAPEAHGIIMAYEAARMLAYEREAHWGRLSAPLQAVLSEGVAHSRERYDWARGVQAGCRAALWQVLDKVEVLITPAAPGEAPEGIAWTGNPAFNRIWTMAGVPCVTVPGLTGGKGLPVGLQVVGVVGQAAHALACAEWVHQALNA